jgi:hypothetical protein
MSDTQSMIDFMRKHTSIEDNIDLVEFANEQITKNLDKRSEGRELSPLLTITNILKAGIQQSFLCCFSESHRSSLMWSHYSNSHTGFCVRYSLNKLLESIPIRKHAKVDYNNEIYNVLGAITKDFNAGQEIIEKILLQKSEDWAYEEEYRLILKKESSSKDDLFQQMAHDNSAVDRIYFGLESKQEDKEFLQEILSGRDIEYFEMVKGTSKFELFAEKSKINKSTMPNINQVSD